MNKIIFSILCIFSTITHASQSIQDISITKVIIPAAGLGTRLLPFTKAVPKEMMPILAKPAIHYIIDEAIQSHIDTIIIITNPTTKNAVHDYFAPNEELQKTLAIRGKENLIADVTTIINTTNFIYIPQHNPKGFGDAIWRARQIIQDDFFGVMLPDDLIAGPQPGLAQLIKIAQKERATVIAVQEVSHEKTHAYGIIDADDLGDGLYRVKHLVEKPLPKNAPSNLAIVGRYVFSPKLFDALEVVAQTTTGEVGVTEAIQYMIDQGEKVFAYTIHGDRYDVGNPMGWLEGIIGMALKDPIYGQEARDIVAKFK